MFDPLARGRLSLTPLPPAALLWLLLVPLTRPLPLLAPMMKTSSMKFSTTLFCFFSFVCGQRRRAVGTTRASRGEHEGLGVRCATAQVLGQAPSMSVAKCVCSHAHVSKGQWSSHAPQRQKIGLSRWVRTSTWSCLWSRRPASVLCWDCSRPCC